MGKLKRGVKLMAAFAGLLFQLVTEFGIATRSRVYTVMFALGLVASGLTIYTKLDQTFFYIYVACVLAAGLSLKAYNVASFNKKEAELKRSLIE